MTTSSALPNRRVEGWRWSDLSAALSGLDAPLSTSDRHVIARLAEASHSLRALVARAGDPLVDLERIGAVPGLDARASEILVEPGATATLISLQSGGDVALSHRKIQLGEGSTLRLFSMTDGARLARLEADIAVPVAGARIELSGLYLAGSGRHADLTSHVVIHGEGAQVRQLVRGVARKKGRGVFQGKFELQRSAQKTDAQMAHNALLLEEGAEIFAKPELEIYADDVQCSHGNTTGQIDEQALFYLRSRGLPEPEARAMIIRAFLIEALPDWLPEDIRLECEQRLDAWLQAGEGGHG